MGIVSIYYIYNNMAYVIISNILLVGALFIMDKIIKAPLFHFLVLGALLFASYSFLNPDSSFKNDVVIVDKGQIQHIKDKFLNDWGREPSADEVKILINGAVLTEIYYREGLKLGLDKNDMVIKKRIRKKMELFSPDKATLKKQQKQMLKNYEVIVEGDK